MHCINPNCIDDKCEGECLEESKGFQERYDNNGLEKELREREEVYCED